MCKKIIIDSILMLFLTTGVCCASECTIASEQMQNNPKTDPVDEVLEELNKRTSELKTYECRIEYKYTQKLLESESLHKGILYYSKTGEKSALRINFKTLKQEDEPEQKYIEQYIVLDGSRLSRPDYEFKGIWLVHIDYEGREAKYYQLAEPNDPNGTSDVLDLAGRNLPILGFSKISDLKKEFDVKLVEQKNCKSADFTQVRLDVKPNSIYKDDYISIDFWIDKKSGLPAKIVAVSTEPEPPMGDVSEIKFLKPVINKGINSNVFDFEIPDSFGEPEIIPIKKEHEQ
jgi:outer membrane lipoprotein-sorting protein